MLQITYRYLNWSTNRRAKIAILWLSCKVKLVGIDNSVRLAECSIKKIVSQEHRENINPRLLVATGP